MSRNGKLRTGLAAAALGVAVSATITAAGAGAGSGAERVTAAGERGAPHAMAAHTRGLKRYMQSYNGTVQGSGYDGAIGTCKSGFVPVSGWFGSKSENVVLGESLPVGTRKWSVGVKNFAAEPAEYVVGIVCVKEK